MLSLIRLVIAALALMAGIAKATPPHIVFFIADDLGVRDSSVYDRTDVRTPNMRRLAANGMTFHRAYVASPSCAPSRAAMLTGMMPVRNGAEANHTHPRAEISTLPTYMRRLGYTVASIGKVFHGGPGQARRYGFDYEDTDRWRVENELTYADRVERFLDTREDADPVCLLVGTKSPHMPWPEADSYGTNELVPPPTHVDTPETREGRAQYYEDVTRADHELGAVYDAVTRRLGENVLFVFSSDHGPQWPFAKWTLYEEGVRVPLIVAWPGRVAPDSRTDAMVSWVDLLPTFIEAAGGISPESIDGRSFVPVLEGLSDTHRDRVFTTHTGDGRMNSYPTRAVREGDWKYIRNLHPEALFTTHFDRSQAAVNNVGIWESWVEAANTDEHARARVEAYHRRPAEELYDLSSDPLEQNNLAGQSAHSDRLLQMRGVVGAHMRANGDTGLVSTALRPLAEVGLRPAIDGWTPAPVALRTPWADDVDPAAPLNDYPRPTMRRNAWTNLNGLWSYAVTPIDSGAPTAWEGQILVPFAIESSLSGVGRVLKADEALWYRRTFDTPDRDLESRVLLHFGAVDWFASVYVNGELIGTHRGGFDGFGFDITDALVEGDTQTVTVRVEDPSDTGTQPVGKQTDNPRGIWYTQVSGIWQTVWLETVPRAHIADVSVTTEIEPRSLTVAVRASSPAERMLRARLTVADSSQSVTRRIDRPLTIRLNAGTFEELWTPDTPRLYDYSVELLDGPRVVDRVDGYFGLRTIEVGPDSDGVDRLLLNGEPVFQMGLLDQGWWPDGLYTAPTDEALAFDIEATKEMGFNFARKHVKVEPERWYYHADRLGLIVWQDMPTFSGSWRGARISRGDPEDPELPAGAVAQFRTELRAMVEGLANHPSIIAWIPFNEGWGQHDVNNTLKWVETLDPTRLVGGPSGWEDRGYGDLYDMHKYPGPSMFPVTPGRASVLSEFGGYGLPLDGHLWRTGNNWGYRTVRTKDEFLDAYEGLIDRLEPLINDGLAAAAYTQTTDVEGEVNGLLTYDRRIMKIDAATLRALHDRTYIAADRFGATRIVLPTAPQERIDWHYTTLAPNDDWTAPGFDDSGWKVGPAGFGTRSTPGTNVGSVWNTRDIWLRNTFSIDELAGRRIGLSIFYDNATEIYVNGTRVFEVEGWSTQYEFVLLDETATSAFRHGKNTIAVHTRQDTGGQFIDAGIVTIEVKNETR
ncbi:MAG: sulfatase-like hydrolase/transferase [Planctomycetota bacterium]